MAYSKDERETHFWYDEIRGDWDVYSNQTSMITKLKKFRDLEGVTINSEEYEDGRLICVDYTLPAKCVGLRSPRKSTPRKEPEGGWFGRGTTD